MILVKTKIGPSSIHGTGLFAAELIPKGTAVWKFVPVFDHEYPKDFTALLSPVAQEQFLNYAYISKETGNYILCADDMRFINHSANPNVINIPNGEQEGLDIAARDIFVGEELTYDYNVFTEGPPTNAV